MKNAIFGITLMGIASVSPVIAATQGALGATSTSTYSNTIGSASLRQIQVLNLSDAMITPSSGMVVEAGGVASRRGIIDRFCVVDTAGSTVKLTFTGIQNGTAQWVARAANGSDYVYFINAGAIGEPMVRLAGAAPSIVIPSSRTVTAASACSTGNVQKLAAEGDTVPIAGTTYVSLMTVVASPN